MTNIILNEDDCKNDASKVIQDALDKLSGGHIYIETIVVALIIRQYSSRSKKK